MTPLWREQAVHAIDVALAEAIYSLAVLPALIQRQTDVPASPTKLLGGADQFNRRWAEQYTAAATSLFGDSDQFSGFLCTLWRGDIHPVFAVISTLGAVISTFSR